MSSAFAANLVTAALAKILIQAGFERAQNSSTSILADIFVRYLELLACTASKHANHQGRTTGNFEDVARVLDDFSVDPTALTEFCRTWAVHINPESVGGNHGNPSSPSHTGAPANSHRHGKAEDHDEPAAFPISE
ncbi:uncharacterized protein EV422DRAFT_360887 [Fimicolochytrium jonesii]|uniref:uncharacterized protein n=1 Tax=Fimicolochytrium jonesii TaxID=1396493 RepID=UPI0022FE2C24|nr:uncharacterized protein EV422DRAFT_360887 [Fimicolochytrium jonesii]KAI8823574.1 hypothetical protein EV422DRAFT_360887 [Fimicolochytrium jonesii]